MHPLLKRRSRKIGAPPGSPVYIGERATPSARISVIQFNDLVHESRTDLSVSELPFPVPADRVTWINIDGLNHPDILMAVGERYGLHPLAVEDVANTDQRPKSERFDGAIFITLKMLYLSPGSLSPIVEQVSMALMPNLVLTFQEGGADVFDLVRSRIGANHSLLRQRDAGYLFYALLDAIVDNYFAVMEGFGERLESLEALLADGDATSLTKLHDLRRELIYLRKNIWPLREVVAGLLRDESTLLNAEVRLHVRDVYDHVVQVIDFVETSRDIIGVTTEIYMSSVSNRLNRVMTTLTIVTSIFVPLTFLVGVYGMNFDYMPELRVPWAYPALWTGMIAIAVVMVLYFRRRRWM